MKICLTWKIIVCGLLCVFPVDIKGERNECKMGYYKRTVDGVCRRCRDDCVTCNINNYCTSCSAGRTGSYCENCKDGYYHGSDRQCIPCNTNCLQGKCDVNGGDCKDGCQDGWSGMRCNDACAPTCASCQRYSKATCNSCPFGHYGTSCERECSSTCVAIDGARKCSDTNGDCNYGCVNGLTGSTCKDQCGANCTSCDRQNGTGCTSCKPGYYGPSCNIACSANCGNINDASRKCQQADGSCLDDCVMGYKGDKCDVPCDAGSPCGCDRDTGDCDGQTRGYQGNGVVIGGAVGSAVVIVLIIVAVLAFIFVKRRRKNESDPERSVTYENAPIDNVPCNPSVTGNDSATESTAHYTTLTPSLSTVPNVEDAGAPNTENYYNTYGWTKSRVQVDTLRDDITSISTEDFEKVFKKLPKGLTRPYDDAVKATNVSKNRYKGIYPYDSTRVKITGNGGDYINASYIQGFEDSEKTYIASSGPAEKFMKGYVEFWEMIWQEKVDKIVMLTNYIEESKMKCEKYWPDVGEHKTYGDINIHCLNYERYADFTVTKLTMKKNSQVSNIHHFHFTAWPDRGTPENVVSLVEFRESVEHVPKITKGPIVVHCSAGIGRTGTYIALDILTRKGRSDNSVDVYGCVLSLRDQRVLMVQNVEQYRFLHYALSHSLTNNCDQIASKDVCTVNTDEIQEQFDLLGTVNVLDSDEEKKAIETNGKEKYKNRQGASIPGDAHRPRLFKYNQNSKSNYINAIYIDGYKEKNRYIIAQTPLSQTVEDFLGLVLQENCSCIISLNPEGITSKQDIGDYLPDVNQELSVGKVKVSCLHMETTPEYVLRKLTLRVQEVNAEGPKIILHYQYTEWPEESPVPSSTGSFLNLVRDSRRGVREPNMPLEPLLIHCLVGGDRSGMFPVVANILEKIISKQQASLVNVVSQVRARRPRAIPNKEQFKYCYELASLFVEDNSVYSNIL